MHLTSNKQIEDLERKLKQTKPVSDFLLRAIQAVQTIKHTGHANRDEAFACLAGCLACRERADFKAAWLLLYVSGALIDDQLCEATGIAIQTAMQQPV